MSLCLSVVFPFSNRTLLMNLVASARRSVWHSRSQINVYVNVNIVQLFSTVLAVDISMAECIQREKKRQVRNVYSI